MKKDRISQKYLKDLYFWFDYDKNSYKNYSNQEERILRYLNLDKKFAPIYKERIYGSIYDCYEYYGLFKLGKDRVSIDPKRYKKEMLLSDEQFQIMSKRNTTFYHPTKKHYYDYMINEIMKVMNDLKTEFNHQYIGIMKKSVKSIKEKQKLTLCDYDNFLCGISGPAAAEAWARSENMKNAEEVYYKRALLINNMYSQFLQNMTSKIEAVSVKFYSKINPGMKNWSRDKLYDNINPKKESSRDLPSFKYHDRLYCIWNFLKHNNLSTYEKLKKCYPEILIKDKYESGEQASFYIKLDDMLINELIDGVSSYFKEWCELNLDENYDRAQWDYDDYFLSSIESEMEGFRNPLGLGPWDDLD